MKGKRHFPHLQHLYLICTFWKTYVTLKHIKSDKNVLFWLFQQHLNVFDCFRKCCTILSRICNLSGKKVRSFFRHPTWTSRTFFKTKKRENCMECVQNWVMSDIIISWLHLRRIGGQIAATLQATRALLFWPTWPAAVDWPLLLDERSHSSQCIFVLLRQSRPQITDSKQTDI